MSILCIILINDLAKVKQENPSMRPTNPPADDNSLKLKKNNFYLSAKSKGVELKHFGDNYKLWNSGLDKSPKY
jgi:hypothetical protein